MFSQNHSRKQMFSPNLFHKMFSPNLFHKMFSPNLFHKMFSSNLFHKMFSSNLFHKMFSSNLFHKMFSPNLFHKTNVSRKVRKKMKGQPEMRKIKFNKEKPCCSERERQQRSFSNSTEKHFYQTFEPVQISEHVSLG